MKKLKIWNGRGAGTEYDKGHIYVAAYSVKQAVELINQACDARITTNEIREYYSDCWGNSMKGIEPTEPCVYATKSFSAADTDKPIRLI